MEALGLFKYDETNSRKETYFNSVSAYVKKVKGSLSSNKYTEYSRTILGVLASGHSPKNVSGYDITHPLTDFEKTVSQGINGAIWALIALDADGFASEALTEKYIDYILARELKGGGFALSGDTADADVTAMALSALSKHSGNKNVSNAINRGLAVLSAIQNDDGTFSSYGVKNAESTAQVIIALCELKKDISSTEFIKNGNTALDGLLKFQNSDGSFRHTLDGSANAIATEQAFLALVSLIRTENGKSGILTFGTNEPFTDISSSRYKTAILALNEKGIVNGMGGDKFMPKAEMTKAEFAVVLTNALNLTPSYTAVFKDVPKDSWYFTYVNAAYKSGIISGVSKDIFNPEGAITDVEAKIMVLRAGNTFGLNDTVISWRPSSVKITREEMCGLVYDMLKRAGKI